MNSNKTEEESGYYRFFLSQLINNIIKELPEDKSNVKLVLESTKMSLFYKAPEILDNSFLDILNILRTHFPLEKDESKNPQYIKNILILWNNACNQIKNGLKPDSSMKIEINEKKNT
tara:strand:- start:231 stop:581 length:351 start_codon:yes stop_codon:yes gene_type:complete